MINTFSKFNYGLTITATNYAGNFNEGGAELLAQVDSGSYTLGEFAEALQDAFNAAGALTYAVAVNRANNSLTISASGNFTLMLDTGTSLLTFWETIGFNQTADLSGAATYTGGTYAGYIYYPQFMLQSYVPPEHYLQCIDAAVNKTASGRVEVVSFGTEQFIEFDLQWMTNNSMDGVWIKNNPQGVEDVLHFLTDVTKKRRFEFVPDVDDPSTFYKVIVESTPGFTNGTGFKLKELYTKNLPGFYETGIIKLRVVT
jgi:hypothetical protein